MSQLGSGEEPLSPNVLDKLITTPKLMENVWWEKQKLRNRILFKARAKFCNFKFERKSVPISDDQIGVLKYYLDMERNSVKVILETAEIIRKKVSEVNPKITQVVQAGITEMLVKFLDDDEISKHFHVGGSNGQEFKTNIETITREYLDQLRFKVVWSLSNIISESSASTDYIVSLNCIGNIKKLLENSESSTNLVEECVWLLGNICGESTHHRDLVLNEDMLPILLRLLNIKKQRLSLLRNSTWCLSKFLRGKPCVAIQYVQMALPTLIDLVNNQSDEEVITDACWAIFNATNRPMEDPYTIDSLLMSGAIKEIISLIESSNVSIQEPCIRIIGNIVEYGTCSNTNHILEEGILLVLPKLLCSSNNIIKKESLWILSNIAAGNENHIRKLINAGLIQQNVDIIANLSIPFTIKKYAYWTMRNICDWPDEDISKYLFDCDIVNIFYNGLNGETCSICLEGIHALLKNSKERTLEEMNKYRVVEMIETIFPSLNQKDQDTVQSILIHYLNSSIC